MYSSVDSFQKDQECMLQRGMKYMDVMRLYLKSIYTFDISTHIQSLSSE